MIQGMFPNNPSPWMQGPSNHGNFFGPVANAAGQVAQGIFGGPSQQQQPQSGVVQQGGFIDRNRTQQQPQPTGTEASNAKDQKPDQQQQGPGLGNYTNAIAAALLAATGRTDMLPLLEYLTSMIHQGAADKADPKKEGQGQKDPEAAKGDVVGDAPSNPESTADDVANQGQQQNPETGVGNTAPQPQSVQLQNPVMSPPAQQSQVPDPAIMSILAPHMMQGQPNIFGTQFT